MSAVEEWLIDKVARRTSEDVIVNFHAAHV